MMRTALVTSLLAMLATPAAAAGPSYYFDNSSWQSAVVRECFEKSPGGTSANTSCAEAEYALQDARLNKAYNALRTLNDADQNNSLLYEERDWIAYKKGFCKAWAQADESANPGLGSDYYVLLCTAQVTSIRASELEYALSQRAKP